MKNIIAVFIIVGLIFVGCSSNKNNQTQGDKKPITETATEEKHGAGESKYDKVNSGALDRTSVSKSKYGVYDYEMRRAYRKKGNFEKALEEFEKAIRINPKNAKAYNKMGVVYDSIGNPDKAIEMFEKAANIDPSNSKTYYYMGHEYDKKGNNNKAVWCFKQSARLGHEKARKYLDEQDISW